MSTTEINSAEMIKTILIADDAEINRDIIKIIFDEQYNIIEAKDGAEAIEAIIEHKDNLSLIFLDLIMPNNSGLDVLDFMNKEGYINTIPVIMITGEATEKSDEKAYEYGASDIIYKPFAPKVVMRRAKNIIELFEHRISLEEKLEKRTKELKSSKKKLQKTNEFLINALSSVVEFRSLETGDHIKRVKYFTSKLLEYLMEFFPQYGITEEQASLITHASALHDIGKIAIADNILLKPGKLSDDEYEEIKNHTIYGCEILEKFHQDDNPFYQYCYDICRHHHERHDGNGYPDGLKGDEIPLCAQIVSIADVYDALVTERVYKSPYAVEEAVRMIKEGECGEFAPDVLYCFDLAKYDFFNVTEKSFSFIEETI